MKNKQFIIMTTINIFISGVVFFILSILFPQEKLNSKPMDISRNTEISYKAENSNISNKDRNECITESDYYNLINKIVQLENQIIRKQSILKF